MNKSCLYLNTSSILTETHKITLSSSLAGLMGYTSYGGSLSPTSLGSYTITTLCCWVEYNNGTWFAYTGPLTNIEVTITRLDTLNSVILTDADSSMLVNMNKRIWEKSEQGKTIPLNITLKNV